jgi:hypothetical protein
MPASRRYVNPQIITFHTLMPYLLGLLVDIMIFFFLEQRYM